jgi:hypothetical protein
VRLARAGTPRKIAAVSVQKNGRIFRVEMPFPFVDGPTALAKGGFLTEVLAQHLRQHGRCLSVRVAGVMRSLERTRPTLSQRYGTPLQGSLLMIRLLA